MSKLIQILLALQAIVGTGSALAQQIAAALAYGGLAGLIALLAKWLEVKDPSKNRFPIQHQARGSELLNQLRELLAQLKDVDVD